MTFKETQLVMLLMLVAVASLTSFIVVQQSESIEGLEFDIKISKPGELAVYFDDGHDFNADQRVVYNFSQKTAEEWIPVQVRLSDINKIKKFRIDPLPNTESEAIFGSIRNVRIKTDRRNFHSLSDHIMAVEMSRIYANHFIKVLNRSADEIEFRILENATDPYLLVILEDGES